MPSPLPLEALEGFSGEEGAPRPGSAKAPGSFRICGVWRSWCRLGVGASIPGLQAGVQVPVYLLMDSLPRVALLATSLALASGTETFALSTSAPKRRKQARRPTHHKIKRKQKKEKNKTKRKQGQEPGPAGGFGPVGFGAGAASATGTGGAATAKNQGCAYPLAAKRKTTGAARTLTPTSHSKKRSLNPQQSILDPKPQPLNPIPRIIPHPTKAPQGRPPSRRRLPLPWVGGAIV